MKLLLLFVLILFHIFARNLQTDAPSTLPVTLSPFIQDGGLTLPHPQQIGIINQSQSDQMNLQNHQQQIKNTNSLISNNQLAVQQKQNQVTQQNSNLKIASIAQPQSSSPIVTAQNQSQVSSIPITIDNQSGTKSIQTLNTLSLTLANVNIFSLSPNSINSNFTNQSQALLDSKDVLTLNDNSVWQDKTLLDPQGPTNPIIQTNLNNATTTIKNNTIIPIYSLNDSSLYLQSNKTAQTNITSNFSSNISSNVSKSTQNHTKNSTTSNIQQLQQIIQEIGKEIIQTEISILLPNQSISNSNISSINKTVNSSQMNASNYQNFQIKKYQNLSFNYGSGEDQEGKNYSFSTKNVKNGSQFQFKILNVTKKQQKQSNQSLEHKKNQYQYRPPIFISEKNANQSNFQDNQNKQKQTYQQNKNNKVHNNITNELSSSNQSEIMLRNNTSQNTIKNISTNLHQNIGSFHDEDSENQNDFNPTSVPLLHNLTIQNEEKQVQINRNNSNNNSSISGLISLKDIKIATIKSENQTNSTIANSNATNSKSPSSSDSSSKTEIKQSAKSQISAIVIAVLGSLTAFGLFVVLLCIKKKCKKYNQNDSQNEHRDFSNQNQDNKGIQIPPTSEQNRF